MEGRSRFKLTTSSVPNASFRFTYSGYYDVQDTFVNLRYPITRRITTTPEADPRVMMVNNVTKLS
jgi:hypothetical protein